MNKIPNEKLLKIAQKFKRDMQKIVNDGNITSISISSPLIDDGKEFVIAEKCKNHTKYDANCPICKAKTR